MKVAFCIREDYMSKRGGDTIQLLKTKKYLEDLYKIDSIIITNPSDIATENPDICHIFNLQTQEITEQFMKEAKANNKKVALSTIFWDPTYNMANLLLYKLNLEDNNEKNMNKMIKFIDILSKTIKKPNSVSKAYKTYLTDMLIKSDVLLPNSIEEIKVLCDFIGMEFNKVEDKTQVVINGVDIADNTNENNSKKLDEIPNEYVLECGRIEPTKNQYAIVKALYNEKHIPIVFLGNQKTDPKYFEKLKKLGDKRGNVFFVDEVTHDEVSQFYKNAAVHILPSFRESPGLSTLEALYNGCKVVVADERFCPIESYFTDIATVINPMDTKSIRDGIMKEISMKRDMDAIKSNLKNNLTWDNAAKQTMQGYRTLVSE